MFFLFVFAFYDDFDEFFLFLEYNWDVFQKMEPFSRTWEIHLRPPITSGFFLKYRIDQVFMGKIFRIFTTRQFFRTLTKCYFCNRIIGGGCTHLPPDGDM